MSEAAATSCPKCGAAIPPEAPQGLCPKCLLQQASFPTETGHTTRHTRPAPPDRDELARAFPHLQILELIGQGGMGFVYKARQPKLDRLVALKILAQPLADQTHFAERFTREGRTLAKLNHPNIVTIHDFGQAGLFFYLLMEYVDGVNLRQAMRAGAVNSSQALAIVPRICEALQYAHNEGVLHRDIKPDNILLDTRGRVKIADFGIAKLMAEAVAENPLTGSGASLGTPHYMAPEQIEKPNAVDHRADIYSLGVVFYEMLTGELPLGRFAAPSEKSAIDPRLDEVVFQTLEKQPERRPQSADEVKTRVETISSGPQHAEPSEGEVAFKMSKCYLTTPQFLSSRLGRLLRYTNKGELRLDEETLTFAPRHQNWIVIPLRAITSLSMGEFPAGIGKIKFISVTFTEKGNTHRFFFVPTRGAFRSIWNTNQLVEEWFNAFQHAAKARTGRVPPSFKDDLDPLPSTQTSKASLSSTILKTAFTLALVVILGLGVGLGAFIGLYALLRHSNSRQPNTAATQDPAVLTSNATATAIAPTGPTKTLNLALDYFGPSPVHNINFKAETDLAADEQISAALRYNDGEWDEFRYLSSWTSDDRLLKIMWPIPDNFSVPFDLQPVIAKFLDHKQAVSVQLWTNAPVALFTVTNALHQRITCGIRYQKSRSNPGSEGILSMLAFERGIDRFDISFQESLPPGMNLAAFADYDGTPSKVRITRQMPNRNTTVTWIFPPAPNGRLMQFADLQVQPRGRLTPPFFTEAFTGPTATLSTNPTPLFAITNNDGKILRGFMAIAPATMTNTAAIFAHLPVVTNSPAKIADTESFELTMFRPTIEPRKITLHAHAVLTLDQTILAATTQPESSPQQAPRRIPPQNTSMWRSTRGLTNEDDAEFVWNFNEPFSLERDLTPAVERFFSGQKSKKVRLTAGQTTSLFSITNAFGEIANCGLLFTIHPGSVKSANTGVIVLSASGNANDQGVFLDADIAFPEGVQIEASGQFDGKPTATLLEHPFSSTIHVSWRYPDGFKVADSNPETKNNPSPIPQVRNRGPVPFRGGSFGGFADNAPPFLRPFAQRLEAGDARITPAEPPLEIFALTNAEGKIFRGTLQMNYGRGDARSGNKPDKAPTKNANSKTATPKATSSPTKDLSLRFKGMITPSSLLFEAPAQLAFNESVRTMIRYNNSKWAAHQSSKYDVSRGSQNTRSLSLSWTLPDSFSFPFDVKPVLDQWFGDDPTKLVKLPADEIVELFSVTNGLKQRISCGLKYERSSVSPVPYATVTNTLFRVSSGYIDLQFYGLAPADTTIEPIATLGTNTVSTSLKQSLNANAEARFNIPSTFTTEPGGKIPDPAHKVLNIGLGEPAEVFSLTNSDNQIYRAFLELRDITK